MVVQFIALIMGLAVAGTKNVSYSGLQAATVLGAAAAGWLLMTCATVRD
jgi:hypothetical protein